MLGLAPAEMRAYLDTLVASHEIRVRVFVHGSNEANRGPLEAEIISGQVDADASRDITRSLVLQLADPGGQLAWGPGAEVFADDFLRVQYGVKVPEVGWVDVPVFYGPVSRLERDAGETTIEAVGKESLYLPPRPYTFPKDPETLAGRKLRDYLRHQAAGMGEERFALGGMNGAKITKSEVSDAAKDRDAGLWPYLVRLAASNDVQLYYNTEGELATKPLRGRHGYRFHDGANGSVLDEPSVGYDLSELRNVVIVKGQDPKGKTVTRAIARLPAQHPLSAQALAWNGEERVLREIVKFDQEVKLARARDVAESTLRRLSRSPVEVSFTSLPIPHLELGDRCELDVGSNPQAAAFQLPAFTLPLVAGELMSVGFTRPFTRRGRGRRSKRRAATQAIADLVRNA